MKKLLLILIISLVAAACTNTEKQHPDHQENTARQRYTCPMHPEITSDKMNKCPKCGMHLEPIQTKTKTEKSITIADLLIPTNEFVVSSIPVVRLIKESNSEVVIAFGKVEYDSRQIGSISSRVSGRIEKLYVRYKYQKVSKGQRVLDIYSPELLTAQQNLLFLVKNDPTNKIMLAAAKQKLILLGMPASQVQSIVRKGKPDFTISIFSNYSGHIQKSGTAGEMSNNVTSQNEMPDNIALTSELPMKEGMYVEKGQNILSVSNPNRTWAVLNVFSDDISIVTKGQMVTIIPETNPENKFRGTVGFVEPFFRPGSKTLTARVYFDNSIFKIPIGSQIKAEISEQSKFSDWLPKTAVVSLGINKIVFKKVKNGFVAHKVLTGVTVNDKIQIISGLLSEELVAKNGQYLMDSESFIKTDN